MKNKALLLSMLGIILAPPISFASESMWWNEPPGVTLSEQEQPGGLPKTPTHGASRALIIVSKLPADTAEYYPAFYDSLIADSIQWRDSSLYEWSITNFLYAASWGIDSVILRPSGTGHGGCVEVESTV